ncbi:MAG: aminotransferase class III-fold pyridoxal phosphate-dependent enzyme [Bacteroidota bacterium]|jgi:acetylornithine aminotransferase
MTLFDVYPRYDVELIRGEDVWVWDAAGRRYLDCYGGHAVISIGHAHPHFTRRVTEQLTRLPFYSNAFVNSLQVEYAEKFGAVCGYPDHQLFLCNSGAEANENALKLASFHTGRAKVLAFSGAFHGRTSGAVSITDNPSIRAPFNQGHDVVFVPLNDAKAMREAFARHAFAAAIIEGIQGVAGIKGVESEYLTELRALCTEHQALLILDEVQSGFGRSGHFFAHQNTGVAADIITIAKGMGNGFPVAGVLIDPRIASSHGLLGTTFGGGQLACAAALAVIEVLHAQSLQNNAAEVGASLMRALAEVPGVSEVRGRGLMIGFDSEVPAKILRALLLHDYGIITGGGGGSTTVRLLPPLTFSMQQAETLTTAVDAALRQLQAQGTTV